MPSSLGTSSNTNECKYFNANWFWNYYNTVPHSTASRNAKCHFRAYLVFYQTPSSCTLSKWVPGYSTASRNAKCHFWAYLVFYQMPSSCTLSKWVPGYSMLSRNAKCHFWVYLVFYKREAVAHWVSKYLATLWHPSMENVVFGCILYFIICIILIFGL